jgi:hypothetical protein
LRTFKVRDNFFEEEEDSGAAKKRRYLDLKRKIKRRIKALFQGSPHAKIESSMPMLPTMPKCIFSAVGEKRKLFKDSMKEKAKNF